MNFNLVFELKKIILATNNLKDSYNTQHTNSKYSLDLIINEILYFLKSGVSWRMLRSTINYKTLFWHYSRFVKNKVFLKLLYNKKIMKLLLFAAKQSRNKKK